MLFPTLQFINFTWLVATFALLTNKQKYADPLPKMCASVQFKHKRKRRQRVQTDDDSPIYALEDYPVFI